MNGIKSKVIECWQGVVSNTIYDLLKLVFKMLCSGGVVYIISDISITAVNLKIAIQYKTPITIVLISCVCIFLLRGYMRKIKAIPYYPPIDMDYEVIERNVTFTYGKELSHYELYIKVKSNVKGLNRIRGKYTWSGSEEAEMECVTKNCRLIPLTRKDSFVEYEVELNRSYKKGKQVECKVKGRLPDSQYKFVPFFSAQISEATKLLVINICIPPEYNVREIILEEIAVIRSSNDDSQVVLLDAEGKYTWKVKNPKLFYKYSVRWVL